MKTFPNLRVALVYDRVNTWGGAEQVLCSLHEIWPTAPLFTSVYDPDKAKWARDWDIRPSFLNNISFFRSRHRGLAMLMPYAFESFDFSDFDVVISVTSAEAKGILTKPHQLHVSYVLTPTRYLWSHAHSYLGKGLGRVILSPFLSSLRQWDSVASQRPDVMIPISNHVSKRIKAYYQRTPARVLYPPVSVAMFEDVVDESLVSRQVIEAAHGDFFLMVGRPVGYKNMQQVIDGFELLKRHRLVVVGSEQKLVRRHSSHWVTQLGFVTEIDLRYLYQQAKALLFPQEEDFGIVAVEAQAAGIPVVALNRGGACETVIDGKTGLLLDSFETEDLSKALDDILEMNWYPKVIVQHAHQFNKARFIEQFLKTIEELWQKHQY